MAAGDDLLKNREQTPEDHKDVIRKNRARSVLFFHEYEQHCLYARNNDRRFLRTSKTNDDRRQSLSISMSALGPALCQAGSFGRRDKENEGHVFES